VVLVESHVEAGDLVTTGKAHEKALTLGGAGSHSSACSKSGVLRVSPSTAAQLSRLAQVLWLRPGGRACPPRANALRSRRSR
jgi:hypothetical protein